MKKTREKLVSVVIPIYNSANHIEQCVTSVLSDPWPRKEVILVNDGSTDESLRNIEQISSDYPEYIRYVSQSNKGANAARNLGMKVAQGEYIQFLDCDDCIVNEKLLQSMNIFIKNSKLKCVYTDGLHYMGKKILGRMVASHNNILALSNRDFTEFTCGLHTNAPLWKLSFLTENELFWDENLRCWQETEYYFRILVNTGGVQYLHYIPEVHYYRRAKTGGISSDYFSEKYILAQNLAIDTIYEYIKKNKLCEEHVYHQWMLLKNLLLQRSIVTGGKNSWKIISPIVRSGNNIGMMKFLSIFPFELVRVVYLVYRFIKHRVIIFKN